MRPALQAATFYLNPLIILRRTGTENFLLAVRLAMLGELDQQNILSACAQSVDERLRPIS